MERIAVVRLSALGDVLATWPAVEALRRAYPHAHLTWIVEPRCAALLERCDAIDEVLPYPAREWRRRGLLHAAPGAARWYRALGRRRFDLALDFQGNLKSASVLRATRARVRLALREGKEPHAWAATDVLPLPENPWHRTDLARLLAAAAGAGLARGRERSPGAEANGAALPPTAPPTVGNEEGPSFSSHSRWRGPSAGGRVVLHPGTSAFMPHKRWPLGHFADLARRLEESGHRVVWSYGPDEEEWLSAGLARMGTPGAFPRPAPTLLQLAEMLLAAPLLVVGDTAPLHLANLIGTPVMALFGPTDPRLYYPLSSPEGLLYRRQPCAPCRDRACSLRHCLGQIGPREAARHALACLAAAAS